MRTIIGNRLKPSHATNVSLKVRMANSHERSFNRLRIEVRIRSNNHSDLLGILTIKSRSNTTLISQCRGSHNRGTTANRVAIEHIRSGFQRVEANRLNGNGSLLTKNVGGLLKNRISGSIHNNVCNSDKITILR